MILTTTDMIMDGGIIGKHSYSKGIQNTKKGSLDT